MSEAQVQGQKNKYVGRKDEPRDELSRELPQAGGAVPEERVRTWTFTIPQSARIGSYDPSSITFRELTADQQIECSRTSMGDRVRLGFEQVKMALYAVDGKRVDHVEFEAEIYWRRFSAKVRQLAIAGFAKVHNTDDSEDASFLESMRAG